MSKKLFILAILVIILTSLNYATSCGIYDKKEIIIAENKIKVDVADNDCKRELGLSGRENLANDKGMLFVFEKVGNYGFWMKDMKFSIDILWLNDSFKVVGIEKNVAISTFPEIFGQNYFAKYVLELPAGFSIKNNIKIGDKIIF